MSLLSELKAQRARRDRKATPKRLTPSQSAKRVKKLRAQGYTVVRRRLPDGTIVVLKSKKRKK